MFLIMSLLGGQTKQKTKQKKKTNPSYLAGWPSGPATMFTVSGQVNTTQPSYVGGWPLSQLTTMCGQIQSERSCSTECSCVFHDPYLINQLSSIALVKHKLHRKNSQLYHS